jgi:hypothetical protein
MTTGMVPKPMVITLVRARVRLGFVALCEDDFVFVIIIGATGTEAAGGQWRQRPFGTGPSAVGLYLAA